MAEPWSDDFAALAARTSQQLRPLTASPPEPKRMRFYKSHPVLATILAVCLLGLFAPLAYAAVHELWITIDPDKSPPEIEHDIRDQLSAAGVNADVHADKGDDGKTRIEVRQMGSGDQLPVLPHIAVKGHENEHPLMLQLDDDVSLESAEQIGTIASSPAVIAALTADYPSDEARATAIAKAFQDAGVSVTVAVRADGVHVTRTRP